MTAWATGQKEISHLHIKPGEAVKAGAEHTRPGPEKAWEVTIAFVDQAQHGGSSPPQGLSSSVPTGGNVCAPS